MEVEHWRESFDETAASGMHLRAYLSVDSLLVSLSLSLSLSLCLSVSLSLSPSHFFSLNVRVCLFGDFSFHLNDCAGY